MTLSERFYSFYLGIMRSGVKGDDCVFSAAVSQMDEEYDRLGITAALRAKLQSKMVGDIAVSLTSQAAGVAADMAQAEARHDAEVKRLRAKLALKQAEVDQASDRSDLLDEKVRLAKFQTKEVLPKELERLKAELGLLDAQRGLLDAQMSVDAWRTKNLLPLELELKVLDYEIEKYKVDFLLPKQVAKIGAEADLAKQRALKAAADESRTHYMRLTILPQEVAKTYAQEALIVEQIQTQRFKMADLSYSVALHDAQRDKAASQTGLVTRQITSYDDKRKIEKAKAYAMVVGMAPTYAGATMLSSLSSAISSIGSGSPVSAAARITSVSIPK